MADAGESLGLFYTWWRGDDLPLLPPLPGLTIEGVDADRLISAIDLIDTATVRSRVAAQHHPYLAWLHDTPVAVGWSAWISAEIGELGITLTMPSRNHYLWDFVTLPAWRGRGIYPHMLQRMVAIETGADRFWIGHDAPNRVSARGILKAGFRRVGELVALSSGSAFVPEGPADRAALGAALLGAPLAAPDPGRTS
jgi:hypothetical protein